MAGDGPVLVGVAQVGVEAGGEVELGVEGEEPEHHLQAAALEAGPGQERVGVDVGDCELGGDAFESLLGLVAVVSGDGDLVAEPAGLGHVVAGGGASGTQRPELSFGVGQGGLRQAAVSQSTRASRRPAKTTG